MKRFIICLLIAGGVLSACSRSLDHIHIQDENAWVYDTSLPVPIQFGLDNDIAITKAVPSGMVNSLGNLDIGVFGLTPSASWTNPSAGQMNPTSENVILCNQAVTLDDQGHLVFNPKRYYPLVSDRVFDFYAYYPHCPTAVNNTVLETGTLYYSGSKSYRALFKNIGYTDILWAKAETAEVLSATNSEGTVYPVPKFNAAYARKVKELPVDQQEKYMPKFRFEHMLTALSFQIKAKDSNAANNLSDMDFKVLGMMVDSVHTSVKLHVASNKAQGDELPEAGTIEPQEISVTKSVSLMQVDNGVASPIDPILPVLNPVEFGSTMMLLPKEEDADGNCYFAARIQVQYGTGESLREEVIPVRFVAPVDNRVHNDGKRRFLKGYKYNFSIIINDPQEIEILTELAPWEEWWANDSYDDENTIDPIS